MTSTLSQSILLFVLCLGLALLAAVTPGYGWLVPVTLVGALPAGCLCLWWADGYTLRNLGLHGKKSLLKQGARAGVVFLVLVLLLEIVTGLLVSRPASEPWPDAPLLVILPVILAGIFKPAITVFIEEAMFRGFFFRVFSRRWTVGRAAFAASILFALSHLPAMWDDGLSPLALILALVNWTLFGMALCFGYQRTGRSLWFGVGFHYAYNLVYSLVTVVWSLLINVPLAGLSYRGPEWWSGNPAWAPESGVLGLFISLGLFAVVWIVTEAIRQAENPPSMVITNGAQNGA